MNRLLGIDFGSKRIGVALTDESSSMALPYSVVENSKGALDEILKICKDNNVSKIIIGESKNFKGKDNAIMKSVHIFSDQLTRAGYEVIMHPEFLTSFQAEQMNYELHGTKDMLDASSATIILQSYIDSNKK
jgi:putative Holliday junction resolvase